MTDLPVDPPLEEERPAEEQRVVGYWTMEDTERLFIIIHTNPGIEKPWSVIGEKLLRPAEDCEKWYKYVITAHSQIPEDDRRAYSGAQNSGRKRKRRKANIVERQFHCQVSNCRKSYGTEGALKFHVTHKHPGVKYIPSYLTPYNSFALFNGQDPNMMTASALSVMNSMDQAGSIRHVVDQMAAENAGMTFEIHAADLEQLQAQAQEQAELTHEGEGEQDHVMEEDHGEPQTPNEEMPDIVQEEMPMDQGQGTVEGESEQTEQLEHEGEGVEHIEQSEHIEQVEHVEQVEQVEHVENVEQVEQVEHVEQVENVEHAEHIEHVEQENVVEGVEGESEQTQ